MKFVELDNTVILPSLLQLFFEFLAVLSPKLESLTFRSVALGDEAVESLAAAVLCHCKHIRSLVVSNCNLSNKSVGDICTAIVRGQTIENFDISDNGIG